MQAMKALLTAKQRGDPQGWQQFQNQISTLKLRSNRAQRELSDALSALDSSSSMAELSGAIAGEDFTLDSSLAHAQPVVNMAVSMLRCLQILGP